MPYDNTFILLVTDGTGGDYSAASNASKLKWKGQMDEDFGSVPEGAQSARRLLADDTQAALRDGTPDELSQVGAHDRLYIVGHGSFGANPVLGGRTATQLADQLYDLGLRHAAVISLVACNSGWGWGDQLPGAVPRGLTSATQYPFGKLFADALSNVRGVGIHAEIRARVGYVTVQRSGRKLVEFTEMAWVNKFVWAPKGYNKRSWTS